jgi:catechol 2,3-dioxygenase-like lactoylglutathione lyase family enzyme
MIRAFTLLALTLAPLPAAAQPAPATAPAAAPAPAMPTQIGRHEREFMFSKISVLDMVRSYRFYTEVIGLKLAHPMLKAPTANQPEKEFVEFPLNFSGSLADPFFVLIQRRGIIPTPDGARLAINGFKVPNLVEMVAKAKAAGSTVVRDPGPKGERGYALVTDPDGYIVEFIQAPSAPAR